MTTVVRTQAERDQQRVAAEEALADGRWPYRVALARGFLVTLDWVEGKRELAPVSETPLDPSWCGRERLRAADAENMALRQGEKETMWWYGAVFQTLGWLTSRDPIHTAPFL